MAGRFFYRIAATHPCVLVLLLLLCVLLSPRVPQLSRPGAD